MQSSSWNLTQYYSSYNDPKINLDLQEAQRQTEQYVAQYRGRISNLAPRGLAEAIETIENLSVLINKPSYYLHLIYEAGGDELEVISKLQSVVDEKTTLINNQLTFFDVELSRRPDLADLSMAEELSRYSYYLKVVQMHAKYILSEDVEQVLALKSLTGMDAWSRFYTDQKAKIEVELNIYGEKKTYGVPGLMDLMKNPDRDIRQLAFEAMTSSCQDNEENVLESYNNIIMDKKITDQLRGYKDAEESKLLSNQISQSFVDSLVETCKDKVDLNKRYYRLKNEILGIANPQWYDIYAQLPAGDNPELEYSWEDCQKIIIDTFSSFHPRFGQIAKEAFDNNWIDGEIRKRKYGGAFCSSFAPGYHPVIICNYKGKFVDISTVAHELGHLIHGVLTEENQTLWSCNYTMSMAEIASLCCETVVFETLYSQVTDKRLKLKLLCEKIEEESGNIFMGGLGRYTFESKVHKLFREQGELSKEQIRELWLEDNFKQVYGDVFEYPEGCQFTWQMVAHFTYIFYNYVYASGLLISSAIYEVIQHDEAKKEIYIDILKAGGSNSPVNLLAKLDLDIESPDFWQIGFRLFESKVVEAEKLWAEIQTEEN
jgi:oligoendopeptidase F